MYDNMFHNYSDKRRAQGMVVTDPALVEKMALVMGLNPIVKPSSKNGVHFTFPNGVTASIQWGPSNYGDHHWDVFNFSFRNEPERRLHSNTAELYIWIEDDNPKWSHRWGDKNCVAITGIFAVAEIQDPAAYQDMEEVLDALIMAGHWQNTPENRAAIYTKLQEEKERLELMIYGEIVDDSSVEEQKAIRAAQEGETDASN